MFESLIALTNFPNFAKTMLSIFADMPRKKSLTLCVFVKYILKICKTEFRNMLYEKFKDLYAEHITSAFIVGPEGLPLEDFFSIDLKTLFRKKR